MTRCRQCAATITDSIFRVERYRRQGDVDFCSRGCAQAWLDQRNEEAAR